MSRISIAAMDLEVGDVLCQYFEWMKVRSIRTTSQGASGAYMVCVEAEDDQGEAVGSIIVPAHRTLIVDRLTADDVAVALIEIIQDLTDLE